jgi:hypothetical protein
VKRKAAISWLVVTIIVALCWVFGPGRKKRPVGAPAPTATATATARDGSIGDAAAR